MNKPTKKTSEEKSVKLQVAISVLQGILEAKGGVIAEIAPKVAVTEAMRFADEFWNQWESYWKKKRETDV